VEPFRREEIELLIKACDACAEAVTHDRRRFTMARPTGKRDKAILLTLLDTGLRASELCALRIGDVDMKTGKVTIRPGIEGKAKGRKGRTVYVGKSAWRFLWCYLTEREDGSDPDEPLFITGRWHGIVDPVHLHHPGADPAHAADPLVGPPQEHVFHR
jgi:integrase/recombinase XerD